jgi:carboxyl-terminal processing protease
MSLLARWMLSSVLLIGCMNAYADPASASAATTSSVNQTTPVPSSYSAKEVERFAKVLQIIKTYYVEPVPDQQLFENAIRGMLEGLDPHSSFLDADDVKALEHITTGEFAGVGIEVVPEDGFLMVITPIDGGPAQKAGVQAGDVIFRIDGALVKDMTLSDAVKKMRGAKGTQVVLTILRRGVAKPLKLTLTRDDVHVPSVTSKLLEGNYGYVRISVFQQNTGTDVIEAVNALQHQSNGKLKGLILDLRNDPGGLLDSGVAVADDFLDADLLGSNKLIVYTTGRLPNSQILINATPGDIVHGLPIVVLINQGSASAAEIVAGALQDHKRALVVGTKSFGKGSVQTLIPLDATSALKLTTALYYTPSGRSIQALGIVPDVIVNDLKLSTLASKSSDESVQEADLKGHLPNGNNAANISMINKALSAEKQPLSTKNLATTDYQLFEALNLLQGMVALQKHS